jgi:hypothetical protein
VTRLAADPRQLGALLPVKTTEADLQRNVRDLARRLGWDLVFHAMQPFHAAERGWPDLVLLRVRDRRLLFVELKAERGRLSDRQEQVIEMLRAVTPDSVFVWRPSDWDEIERVLR